MAKLRRATLLMGSAAFALSAFASAPAWAQDETEDEADDRIVVTGTRVEGKSPTETLSPVDLHPGAELTEQGSFDLTDQLTNIAPSINSQRFPISDGTAFIRPVSLRNLPPDQTLVLVNGARRHRSALVNLQAEPFGTVNQGAQAVDFGIIPSIAIKRLEVLRDGASAQYGSDAIAGVFNVILRDDREGFEVTGQYGQMYEGDGENWRVAANVGIPLWLDGFLNISGEYVNSQITSRGMARPDAAAVAAVVGADQVPFNGLGQRWGDPDIEGFRFFANMGFDIGDTTEVYAHGSYADQENRSGFFYRTPFGVAGVDPRGTLCVCVMGVPQDTPQSIVDEINMAGLDPNDYLTADAGSPSGFVSLNPIWTMFPGGYNPTFGADITDYEAVAGIRGGTDVQWDLKIRTGQNQVAYLLDNSINPSLGINSPTTFNPGNLRQREFGVNADFVYPWEVGFASPMNVAFGVEYRRETYMIRPGDPASYEFGPTGLLFGVGSDGFQGDSPAASGNFDSDSYAGYIDLEANLTDAFSVGAAVRYENFEALDDDDISWKIAARLQMASWLAVRATVNTGFRTPTPGQLNTLDVTTTADAMGNLIPQGTFPPGGVVAQTLGANPVGPEESFTFAGGLIFTPRDNISLTVDYYNIDVNDRIALTNRSIMAGSPEDLDLIAAGFPGIRQASFFQNAFDATVQGVEIAATGNWDVGQGNVELDFRHAWQQQQIDSVLPGTISAESAFDFENQLPTHRSVLTASYDTGHGFGGFIRANRYGSWEDFTFGEFGSFGSEWVVDVEVHADIGEHFRVAAGAENVFDQYPDLETNSTLNFLGVTHALSSPFGFNGGFWYARITARF